MNVSTLAVPGDLPSSATVLARCRSVTRVFGRGATATTAVRDATCEVSAGQRVVITGPSGSGKSTLLHLLAGLDTPTEGVVDWPAIGARGALRPGPVAVVFQAPSLIGPLDVLENVALVPSLAGAAPADARAAALRALEHLELAELAARLPDELSGGQAQRVAIARAVAGSPRLVVADEPTGQLDQASAAHVLDVLFEAAASTGAALVVSTHDVNLARRFETHWTMADGSLTAVLT